MWAASEICSTGRHGKETFAMKATLLAAALTTALVAAAGTEADMLTQRWGV